MNPMILVRDVLQRSVGGPASGTVLNAFTDAVRGMKWREMASWMVWDSVNHAVLVPTQAATRDVVTTEVLP